MTKTYTLHRWAYTSWIWGNNLSKVPSRIWLRAYLKFKRDKSKGKDEGWITCLDDATTFFYYIGYVDDRTSDNFPFGRIIPNQD